MPITRINRFEAKRGSTEKLQGFLRTVISTIEKSPGCRSVKLLQSTEDPGHLAIIEEWDSVESHQEASKAISPEQMKQAMVLFRRPPAGEYYQ